MNESEIKDKVNHYRSEIEQRSKEIESVMRQIRLIQKDANRLRSLRDDGNEKCKKLSAEAKELREKRDSLNGKIVVLKEKRGKLMKEIKGLSGEIKSSKEKRDKLNMSARGTDSSLNTLYEKNLNALMTEDMPLKREIRLFESIFDMEGRLKSAKEATELHIKVVSTYEGLKGLDTEADTISAEIRKLADESEKYHLEAVSLYDSIDKMRKESDEYHKQLLEKYDAMNPLRDGITVLREEIKKVQEEMSPYSMQLDELKSKKDEERKAKLALDAKEKLKSSKRLSFDDFRALIEGNGISIGDRPSGS
jgi:uncharacterized coiled-coil DUF342 family protein